MTIRNFIAETLRKHPAAGKIMRVTTKPYKVPDTDFTIPKGMLIFIPILGIHHDERFFSNPEKFRPERFQGVDSDAFMPFGDGMCFFLLYFYYFVTRCEVQPFNLFLFLLHFQVRGHASVFNLPIYS